MAIPGKKKRVATWLSICLVVIAAGILAVDAFVFPLFGDAGEQIVPNREQYDPESYFIDKDNLNLLVLGADSREADDGRSDTLIFMTCDLTTKKVFMLSIPRDSRVDIPGRKNQDKINHAYAYGGVELTRETVENLLKVPIDYYVQTDFAGFETIIDKLGGVEIDVDKRMYYKSSEGNIDLQPGLQTLMGKDALGYVRYRQDALGDITRTGRQQIFLKAVAKKMLSAEGLAKLPGILPDVYAALRTDMSTKQLAALALVMKDMDVDTGLTTMTLPGDFLDVKGISYWNVDPEEAAALVKEQMEQMSQPEPAAGEPAAQGEPTQE